LAQLRRLAPPPPPSLAADSGLLAGVRGLAALPSVTTDAG